MVSGVAFDAIVSNLVLPRGQSGLDLLQSVQAGGTPVLLMTGDTHTLVEFAQNGTPHLQKPFDLDRLFDWINAQSGESK